MRFRLIIFFCIGFLHAGYSQKLKVFTDKDTVSYADLDAYYLAHNTREGYWIVYFEDGVIKEEGRYSNDLMQGKWIRYYSDGNKCEELTYVENRVYGPVIFYYENGNKREEGTWLDKHWVGEYRYYYETGILQYSWLFDELGMRTGQQMYFHENGSTMIEGEWKSGLEAGAIKEYYDDGTVKSEKVFSSGKVDSSSVKVYERKTLPVVSKPVANADTIGLFTGNGYFKTKNKFKKIDFDGIWKNGKYFDGQKFVYNETGKLIKIHIYKNGQKVGEKTPE